MIYARPKIKIVPSSTDLFVEKLGICLLILLWILSVISYLKSPDTVAIHYNAAGNADGFGSKINILFLPLIPTAIYFLLGWLNKYPHVFNYPVTITAENAAKQYTNATKMIRALKIAVLLVFTIIILFSFFTTMQIMDGLGAWFLPITTIVLAAPTVFYVYRAFKAK